MSYYALRGIDHAAIQRAKAEARKRGTTLDDALFKVIRDLACEHKVMHYNCQYDRMECACGHKEDCVSRSVSA